MKMAKDAPMLKKWADDFKGKSYLNMLKQNNQIFETIHKALDEFLEKKREGF